MTSSVTDDYLARGMHAVPARESTIEAVCVSPYGKIQQGACHERAGSLPQVFWVFVLVEISPTLALLLLPVRAKRLRTGESVFGHNRLVRT